MDRQKETLFLLVSVSKSFEQLIHKQNFMEGMVASLDKRITTLNDKLKVQGFDTIDSSDSTPKQLDSAAVAIAVESETQLTCQNVLRKRKSEVIRKVYLFRLRDGKNMRLILTLESG